ncbi:PEP-CTERM motif protein [Roseimaritima multifibrata]|uniref:PEP-CTERM motif protein n=1 Tax=Roseimaritima multifibrata TaxID=1930274 RepID=A0A517MH52_9BACT|nr:PEP-CTERM sorting domain-containing protein [Roseimaritima multifibrata]QDS94212.1 PEP-CTERM motif protein [Roseimaritima multifibrata]
MMRTIQLAVACVAMLAFTAGQVQAGIITTTTTWDGTSSISSFGELNSATYGQTFLVSGSDDVLDSWTFFLNDSQDPDFVDFAFYVMDWDAGTTRATGSVLYQSAAVSTSNNGGFGGMEAFTFNTGGLQLTSGNDYIAFVSATGLFDGSNGTASAGSLLDESVYADGSFFWQNNGNTAGTWDTQGWSSNGNFGDLAFTATFSESGISPVPEPSSLALFGFGACVAGAGAARRRRREKQQETTA